MENGDRQRQMDFVLNMLADVTTKISSLTDSQARTDATVAELAGQVQTLAEQVQITDGQVQILTGQAQITDGQVQRIARQQQHINEVIAVIADSQQHTDERLNALIDIVRNDRNGQS
jgi:chromosome segregation ATPase